MFLFSPLCCFLGHDHTPLSKHKFRSSLHSGILQLLACSVGAHGGAFLWCNGGLCSSKEKNFPSPAHSWVWLQARVGLKPCASITREKHHQSLFDATLPINVLTIFTPQAHLHILKRLTSLFKVTLCNESKGALFKKKYNYVALSCTLTTTVLLIIAKLIILISYIIITIIVFIVNWVFYCI